MSDKRPYASTGIVTLERVIATVWAIAWVVVAYGFAWHLALRLFLFFSIPVAFIWVPEGVCMIMTLGRKSYEPEVFVTPGIVRWFGWFVLIGVPVGWFLFAHAAR